MRNLLVSAALAGAAAALAVFPAAASAAKALPATLTATPQSTTYTDSSVEVYFGGCGYLPSTGTTIVVNTPSAISFFGGPSDASGCVDLEHNGFITSAGTYSVQAWQDNAHGRAMLMASTSFVIN